MDDLWKKTDKELAKIEKKLEKIYQEAYKDLAEKWDQYMSQANSEVAPFEKAYQKAKESGDAAKIQKAGIALSEAKKKATVQNAYWQGMVNQVAERYEHVNETALAYVNGKIPGIYAMNLNGTLQEIETDAGKVKMGVAFDMVDERTVRNLVKRDDSLFPQKKMDKAKDKAWNKKAINSQILQGILQGESIPKIAHRLQNVTDMNAAAATRNARTMCTAAENNGRLSGLKEAEEKGIVYEKQWMSTHDDRTRESHQELDGVSVPVDEEFPNGLMYPGDPDGEPEEVYNCRCSLVRKLIGFRKKDGSISEVEEIHKYNPDYFQTAEEPQQAQAEKEKAPLKLTKLESAMPKDDFEKYKELVENAENRNLYEKYGDSCRDIRKIPNGGYYQPATDTVNYSYKKGDGTEKYSTLAHEMGHMFDAHIKSDMEVANFSHDETMRLNEITQQYQRLGIKAIEDLPSSSDQFISALRQDMEALKPMLQAPSEDGKIEYKGGAWQYYANKTQFGREVFTSEETYNASHGIQDALDGFFGTQDRGILGWGHGNRYYNQTYNRYFSNNYRETKKVLNELGFDVKNKNDVMEIIRQYDAGSEAWANISSAVTLKGEELRLVEKYMPNALREYKNIISKV